MLTVFGNHRVSTLNILILTCKEKIMNPWLQVIPCKSSFSKRELLLLIPGEVCILHAAVLVCGGLATSHANPHRRTSFLMRHLSTTLYT